MAADVAYTPVSSPMMRNVCLVVRLRSCPVQAPPDLYTEEWLKLLVGLVQTFTLGKVPNHDVADTVKSPLRGRF